MPDADERETSERLIGALAAGQIRSVLAELHASGLADPTTDRVAAAVAALDGEVAAVAAEFETAASRLGIEPRRLSSPWADHAVGHCAFALGRSDLERATAALADQGLTSIHPLSPGGARSEEFVDGLRTFASRESPVRVDLHWRDGRRRFRRLLHPGRRTWQSVNLPAPLWPAYHLLHFVRLPSTLWSRRTAPDLGPFLGTPETLIDPLLAFAEVGPGDTVIDLGCGDGRLVIEAARRIGCRSIGVESESVLVAEARQAADDAGVASLVEIHEADAAGFDLHDATVVLAFLPAPTVEAILGDVLDRLAGGARFVIHEQAHFEPSVRPDEVAVLAAGAAVTGARLWRRSG